jgi:hypothetical protein
MRRLSVLITVLVFLDYSAAFGQGPEKRVPLENKLNIHSRALVGVRTMADVDMLSDGRIVILDNDTMRVGIFTAEGDFDHWLAEPRGIPPSDTFLTRLVALQNGGLVLADWKGHRFLFYDKELRPQAPIPFGREIVSVNGFLQHPVSRNLYLVGYCPQNGKILHRFDEYGQYLGSDVASLDVPEQQQGLSTGYLAVDPSDGTLWLSRLTPYEILHLTLDGSLISAITRGPGTLPRTEPVGPGQVHYLNFHTTLRIAVVGDHVVNSYFTESQNTFADVFTRDGTLVEAEVRSEDPRTLAKRLGNGMYVRHFNAERRVELWRSP